VCFGVRIVVQQTSDVLELSRNGPVHLFKIILQLRVFKERTKGTFEYC